jgi:hypothetical protein
MVVVSPHRPAVRINVYVVVAVLFNAGDHVPITPLFEVVGKEFNVSPEQMAETCVNEGDTELPTVIVEVCEQPLLFLYVIVDVPNATAVTSPLLETVAIVVSLETQGFVVAAAGEPESCDVVFRQRSVLPSTLGKAFTVIDAVVEHPLLLV